MLQQSQKCTSLQLHRQPKIILGTKYFEIKEATIFGFGIPPIKAQNHKRS